LLLERGQYIHANGLLQLGWGQFFVGTFIDPGFRRIPLAILLEPIQQFSQSAN
jgi:hypothetical protein